MMMTKNDPMVCQHHDDVVGFHNFCQAWAETEAGLLRGPAAYCLDRFQRYEKSRLHGEGVVNVNALVQMLLDIKHSKLENNKFRSKPPLMLVPMYVIF